MSYCALQSGFCVNSSKGRSVKHSQSLESAHHRVCVRLAAFYLLPFTCYLLPVTGYLLPVTFYLASPPPVLASRRAAACSSSYLSCSNCCSQIRWWWWTTISRLTLLFICFVLQLNGCDGWACSSPLSAAIFSSKWNLCGQKLPAQQENSTWGIWQESRRNKSGKLTKPLRTMHPKQALSSSTTSSSSVSFVWENKSYLSVN